MMDNDGECIGRIRSHVGRRVGHGGKTFWEVQKEKGD